ncbi:hypothetical protein [Brucella intermedia]|uniref:hypothetical protein n=1 Tax=Brucella intermedia TaxID=94625 RepID=UPI001591DCE8|nr:hypothetical protein [Brucella intermedia]
MQTYSARVRLSGSLFNEVPKAELTAAEITVLRRLHGPDSVVEIKPGKHVDRSDDVERDRLNHLYGRALAGVKGVGTLDAVLGVPGVPLPSYVPGVDASAQTAPRRSRKTVDTAEPESDALPVSEEEFS